ncbi:MAG: hypothetical protein GY799_01965, partial [Desulfobulbaceae bacterium]|nr:hypothetical protein [Desulfobulbaceae bacterium]
MEPPIKQKFIIEVDGEGQIKAYNQDLKTNEKQTKENTKANKKMSSSLAKAAVSFATVATAVKAAKIAWELGELGAKVQTVDKNFQNFARQGGMNSVKMMGDLRKASAGMMDDMFLQQQAMKGMISGIKFDDMIVAMEYVRNYAISTGDDVNAKMQTVMTGLARGSAQFMDDVGIQVIGSKDVVNDTINQMKEKMGQFTDTTNETSVAIANMKSEFSNLKQYIGEILVPTTNAWVKGLRKGIETAGEAVKGFRIMSMESLGKDIEDRKVNLEAYKVLFKESMKKVRSYEDKHSKIGLTKAKKVSDKRAEIVRRERAEIQKMQAEYSKLYKELYTGGDSEKGKSGGGGSSTVIPKATKQVKELKKELGELTTIALPPWLVADNKRIAGFGAESAGIDEDYANSILVSQEEAFPKVLSSAEQFALDYGSIIQSSVNSIGGMFSTMYSNRQHDMEKSSQAEIEAIRNSTMSEKQKAKEIEKIEKKSQKERKKAAMAEWTLASSLALTNTFLAGTKVMAEQAGGVGTKALAYATITALGLGAVGSIAASKPKFYHGSKDSGGSNYTTVGGHAQGDAIPALLRSGETILTPKDSKKLLNSGNTSNNSNVTITAPITIQG